MRTLAHTHATTAPRISHGGSHDVSPQRTLHYGGCLARAIDCKLGLARRGVVQRTRRCASRSEQRVQGAQCAHGPTRWSMPWNAIYTPVGTAQRGNWELGARMCFYNGCALWRHSRRHAAVTACAVICDPQSMLASCEQCTRWQKTLVASFQLWRCPSAICDR